MKYRKLRIAWSVTWGIVCLLLVAVWVRSYSYLDTIGTPPRVLTSWRGRLLWGGTVYVTNTSDRDEPSDPKLRTMLGVYVLTTMDQGNITYQGGSSLPLTIPLMMMATMTVAPWLRLRYSLRTLIIGMTAAAIGLGWIAYTLRA
jgi:hypothetical protein